jgi:hypothetical protein
MYRPLRSISPSANIDDERAYTDKSRSKSTATDGPHVTSTRLCFVLCLFLTVINIYLSLLPSHPSVSAPLKRSDISGLRRPSQFMHFDEISRPVPAIARQFNNYPTLVTQVNSEDKTKVYAQDTRRYMSPLGSISLEEVRVMVTQAVSTVVQFRAMDYGMGICELHLSLPSMISSSGSAPSESHDVRSSGNFGLYRLESSVPLDASNLSYQTRPARVSKLADFPTHRMESSRLDSGTWLRNISCAMEETITVELACSDTEGLSSNCAVEWWQDKGSLDPAIYITQYSTV